MPVLDHEVSPLVVLKDGSKPGCFNHKPISAGYWAPDRIYLEGGKFVNTQVFVPHTMSTDCRYDQAIAPERCEGCIHHNGEQYVSSIRSNGA
jgi:hypothetical protein